MSQFYCPDKPFQSAAVGLDKTQPFARSFHPALPPVGACRRTDDLAARGESRLNYGAAEISGRGLVRGGSQNLVEVTCHADSLRPIAASVKLFG